MTRIHRLLIQAVAVSGLCAFSVSGAVGEQLPWQTPAPYGTSVDGRGASGYGSRSPSSYAPSQTAQVNGSYGQEPAPDPYQPGAVTQPSSVPRANDAYSPPRGGDAYSNNRYPSGQSAPVPDYRQQGYSSSQPTGTRQYGSARRIEPYEPDYGGNAGRYQNDYDDGGRRPYGSEADRYDDRAQIPYEGSETYSRNEVIDAGHRFFGSLSSGLAQAVEYLFQSAGRPNGYILGEGAGGAFIAGLRYGEGKLYTKHAGVHRVFWQGPSIGYDFGGDGTRTMTLVYNLKAPAEIFQRFGGVQGSAYVVGGASVQLLNAGNVTLAPIRTGIGFRLGANIGYLKYTPRPTWNPF